MISTTSAVVMLALCGLACSYLAASVLLLRKPDLIHARKDRFPRCVHISHRGGAAEAVENTMAAFRRCLNDAGGRTDMLELDVHLSADGVAVVSHDDDLGRITDVNSRITNTNFEDLPKIAKKVPIDFEPGNFFESDDVDARRFCSLEEVFSAFPGVPVNVDVKDRDPALVAEVRRLVRAHDRADVTVWGNFSHETTGMCFRADPDIGILFSFRRVLVVLALFYTGLLPFVPLRETHFEIPVLSALKDPRRGAAGNAVLSILDAVLMRRWLFEHLRRRGVPVYAWVLNTDEQFEYAFAKGVSGVMTDRPTRLRAFLDANPRYADRD